jgi:hypothetical protein
MFHRHKWAVVSSGQYVSRAPWQEKGTDVTVVLYKCECGKHKTEQIDGLWTTKELTA